MKTFRITLLVFAAISIAIIGGFNDKLSTNTLIAVGFLSTDLLIVYAVFSIWDLKNKQ